MKYISNEKFGYVHNPYWQYLDLVEGIMPTHMFAFAANPDNHDLENPNSLHDSWLDYWRTVEAGDNQQRSLQIEARLLGPRHDRHIHLKYINVEKYNIHGTSRLDAGPRQTPHGDLLIHEFIVVRPGLFSHELLFSKGAVFVVEFTEFEHRIEAL